MLVVGAGLAGLHTATLLARHGHDVLLLERRPRLTGTIRTTGIFMRRTLDDFPLPPGCLGPPIRRVVLYPPGLRRPVTLVSSRDEYRVGDMAPLYVAYARAAADAGVRMALGTRYAGRRADTILLAGRDGPTRVRVRFVVGADGARSRVARDLALDRNHHLLIGAEEVFEVPRSEEPPAFHCVLDPSTPRSLPATWRGWSTTGGMPTSAWPATPTASRTVFAGPWSGSVAARPGCPASTAPMRSSGARVRSPSVACCVGSAAPTGFSWGMQRARSRRSPLVAWICVCGCPRWPQPSSTTRCGLGGRTR